MVENTPLGNNGDTVRRFRRSKQDRMLGGVCGGAAKLLNIDVSILRVILVAATVLGFGAGAVIYVASWLIVPEED
jgi:phage shock protein C